jgi:hypothetical protein
MNVNLKSCHRNYNYRFPNGALSLREYAKACADPEGSPLGRAAWQWLKNKGIKPTW